MGHHHSHQAARSRDGREPEANEPVSGQACGLEDFQGQPASPQRGVDSRHAYWPTGSTADSPPSAMRIYFLVHNSHRCFKVGFASNPLRRWAQIQAHDQTDFQESLVFDVARDVSHRWTEETIHRWIAAARLEMPASGEGYTEWFDYEALDAARRFATDYSSYLGLGRGYTLINPSMGSLRRTAGPALKARAGRSIRLPDVAASWNKGTATAVEGWASRLLASESLLWSAEVGDKMLLYFRRDRVSLHETNLHPFNSVVSVFDSPSGLGVERWIIGGARDDGKLIRLSLSYPFYFSELSKLIDRDSEGYGAGRTWVQTTPHIQLVGTALKRLVDSAPSLAGEQPGKSPSIRDGWSGA